MNAQTYRVQMKDGWWTVFRGRSKYPYSVHATEERAVASASLMAGVEGGKVILHQSPDEMEESPVRSKSRKLLVLG